MISRKAFEKGSPVSITLCVVFFSSTGCSAGFKFF